MFPAHLLSRVTENAILPQHFLHSDGEFTAMYTEFREVFKGFSSSLLLLALKNPSVRKRIRFPLCFLFKSIYTSRKMEKSALHPCQEKPYDGAVYIIHIYPLQLHKKLH